jgi:hypothetical protein
VLTFDRVLKRRHIRLHMLSMAAYPDVQRSKGSSCISS